MLLLLGVFLSGIGYVLVQRRVIRPMLRMTATMRRIAEGDLQIAIAGRDRRDEIGDMASALVVFRDGLVEGGRLAAERECGRERAALVDMAQKLETEIGAVLEAVGGRTAALTKTAEEMSASASRTGTSAEGATSAATQAMDNVHTVASAAEQLATSIREISSQVGHSAVVAGRAVAAGKETRATMAALNEQVGQIGPAAGMIAEIAARTNLLALNATIEAARAGDAGRGFAVVANEVKQLATQTARSTEEIPRHIGQVRAATGASVEAVSGIERTIEEVNTIAGSIAAAVEQQGAATQEIARNVAETATAAGEMTKRIREMSTEAEQTGRRTKQVHDDTAALNAVVDALRRSAIRMVRTATVEVNRRSFRRRPWLADVKIVPCQPPRVPPGPLVSRRQ